MTSAPTTVPATGTPGAEPPGGRGRLRRLARWVAGLLVLLVVLVFAAGGWYFSGQIYADGLQVRTYPVTDDVRLTLLAGGTVAVRATTPGDLALLRSGSTYGVAWDGGYGQVSGAVRGRVDGGVVRDFTLLEGTLRAGTVAHLDRAAFPEAPVAALGSTVREVAYHSPVGDLPAWFVPGRARTWAVLVHGKGGSRTEMLRMMRTTVAAGMPSLDIGYRNDAGAPRDPSGQYGFGRTEWEDLAAAVGYARAHGARHVVLVGASMGGAVIASYLRHVPGHLVSGIVLDAPMLDFGRTVSFGAQHRALPLLGHVPAPLTWTAKQIATQRYGVRWGSLDYLGDTSWLRVPTLVFHGRDDATVPPATSEQLRDEHPGLVRLDEVAGADHVACWNQDPRAYDATLARFLRRL